MKKALLLAAFAFNIITSHAQHKQPKEISVALKPNQHIIIITGNADVDFEGYNGDDLVISSVPQSPTVPEAAKGLKKVANKNAGRDSISYTLTSENSRQQKIKITTNVSHLKIKVPQGTQLLTVQANSLKPNSLLTVTNIEIPLQVNAVVSNVLISKANGPFIIQADYGNVTLDNINWKQDAKWPLTPLPPQFDYPYIIRSKTSNITIKDGLAIKASLHLKAPTGHIISKYKHDDIITINGGGVNIYAETGKGYIKF